jgi:nitrite reductase (NO-forming)
MNSKHFLRCLAPLVLAAGVITGCGGDKAPQAEPPAVAAVSEEAASGPILGTLAFQGSELKFEPAAVQVDQPGRYAVTFTNAGHTDHDLVIGGLRLVAKPGETVSGEVYVPAEGLEFICSFPGHAPAGMVGRISVQ